MKDADRHRAAILRRIQKHGCVLMLDFDGVLSPLVKRPSNANISSAASRALAVCVKKMPVAIITGRALADIKKRVALRGITYAGSHGLEWSMRGRVHRRKISRAALFAFTTARSSLVALAGLFPRLCVEDKKHCFALGYRSLPKNDVIAFRRAARKITNDAASAGAIRVIDNLYTFEILPVAEWTKGECAKHIFKTVAKKGMTAVYIGDSLTDEDAFRAFAKNGITMRVGRNGASAARFYLKSRSGVDALLTKISSLN